MKVNPYWLWALWLVMLSVMIWKWKFDSHMVVALIVLPILMSILELHEELNQLKEENKHQRKFVLDRYNALSEKLKEASSQMEKRMVVDFAEFARSNPTTVTPALKKRKRRRPASFPESDDHGRIARGPHLDLTNPSVPADLTEEASTIAGPGAPPPTDAPERDAEDDFDDDAEDEV